MFLHIESVSSSFCRKTNVRVTIELRTTTNPAHRRVRDHGGSFHLHYKTIQIWRPVPMFSNTCVKMKDCKLLLQSFYSNICFLSSISSYFGFMFSACLSLAGDYMFLPSVIQDLLLKVTDDLDPFFLFTLPISDEDFQRFVFCFSWFAGLLLKHTAFPWFLMFFNHALSLFAV